MTQKIEIKIERAFLNSKIPYVCIYVNGEFTVYKSLTDCATASGKKWLKGYLDTKDFQDKLKK